MLETLLITPLALAYEYYLSLHGTSAYQTAETSYVDNVWPVPV